MSFAIERNDGPIELHKTDSHVQLNVTDTLDYSALEILSVLATNPEIRKYLLVNGDEFDWGAFTDLVMAVAAKSRSLSDVQDRVTTWVTKCFGSQTIDAKVRAMRLLEEANEFAQSVGVPQDKAADLVSYVYSRPVGEPSQELGGIGVTVLAAAEAIGVSFERALLTELNRIEAKSPEHFAARNQAKSDAGFGL